VRFGASNAGAGNAPIYLAEDFGYFSGQGIGVDETFFASASEVIPGLTRGDVDAAVVGINPATLNALAGNFGLKLVADGGSQPDGFALNVFVVAKEMSGTIKGPADLRGRKVALTPPGLGTASGFMLSKYLAQANMSTSDVDIVPLNFPDQIAALTNHSIDMAQMAEPFATQVVQHGGGSLLITGDKVTPNQQVAAIVFTDQFLTKQKDLGVKFLTAYTQGARAYLDAFGPAAKDKDRVIQVMVNRTELKDAQLWSQIYPTGMNADLKLNVQSMSDAQAYFQKLGLVQTPADLSKVTDTSVMDAVIQKIGAQSK
jgi:NitT/TauT family transport system substrate-binding protein